LKTLIKQNYGRSRLIISSQSGSTMYAAIFSMVLGRIKLEPSYLIRVTFNSISQLVLYWEKTKYMVLRASSFWNFILVNLMRLLESTDEQRYSTPATILASSLRWLLSASSWYFRSHSITSTLILYKLSFPYNSNCLFKCSNSRAQMCVVSTKFYGGWGKYERWGCLYFINVRIVEPET
jgi:hypothetical protein